MAASITDHFKKGYGFFSTTLSSQKNASASSMSLSDATGVPTTTGLVFTVGRVNSSGTSTPSTRAIYKGTLSGTTVSNLTLTEGTDQTHAAGTVVEITFTATHWNDAVDGIVAEHNQDGTHAAVTATSLSVSNTITTNTINENTAANGVTIDGLNIKDNYIVGSATSGVKNSSLGTAATDLGSAWEAWTPTLSGRFDDAKWTKNCKYKQVGKTVACRFNIAASTTTPMSGGVAEAIFTLPVTSAAYTGDAGLYPMGAAIVLDSGTAQFFATFEWNTTTTGVIKVHGAGGTYVGYDSITSTAPMTWTTSDAISGTFVYEAA